MASFEAIEVSRIRQFPAIRVEVADVCSGPHDMCTLYVDVAEDQSLKVVAGPNSEDDPPTCETARRFAGAAMRTLTASRG